MGNFFKKILPLQDFCLLKSFPPDLFDKLYLILALLCQKKIIFLRYWFCALSRIENNYFI